MKTYKEVVEQRYDGREKNTHIYQNRYAMINPVGFYPNQEIREALYKVFNHLRREGRDITQMKILDVGCGEGTHTRFMAELIQNAENISGMDLSTYRIKMARKLNSSISYRVGDLLNLDEAINSYDMVTAYIVFLHISTSEEISRALVNIHKVLKADGVFLWCEIYDKDHFKTRPGDESSGYHPNQMNEFCSQAGFTKSFSFSLFKKVGRRYNSFFLYKYLPPWLVKFIQFIIPASPGMMITGFVKKKS